MPPRFRSLLTFVAPAFLALAVLFVAAESHAAAAMGTLKDFAVDIASWQAKTMLPGKTVEPFKCPAAGCEALMKGDFKYLVEVVGKAVAIVKKDAKSGNIVRSLPLIKEPPFFDRLQFRIVEKTPDNLAVKVLLIND